MIICKLDEFLRMNNITQKDISEILDINKNTISNYANNKFTTINKDHLSAFCEYFKCTPNDIFTYMSTEEYNNKVFMAQQISSYINDRNQSYKLNIDWNSTTERDNFVNKKHDESKKTEVALTIESYIEKINSLSETIKFLNSTMNKVAKESIELNKSKEIFEKHLKLNNSLNKEETEE